MIDIVYKILSFGYLSYLSIFIIYTGIHFSSLSELEDDQSGTFHHIVDLDSFVIFFLLISFFCRIMILACIEKSDKEIIYFRIKYRLYPDMPL